MKVRRGIVLVLVVLILTPQAGAKDLSYKVYLPAMFFPPMDGTMGIWNYVEPLGATNLVKDPSFEGSEWAINAGAPTIVGGEGKFGVYASNVALNNNFVDETDAATITPGNSYVLSYWAKAAVAGQTPTARVRFIWRTAVPAAISTETLDLVTDDDYERASVVAVAPALSDNIQMIVESTGAQFANIDGINVVEGTQLSTHIDGDQDGCEWNGVVHGSSSTRSALSRAGGVVTDFQDLNFEISGMIGAGMSPITLNVDRYAVLPGGELNSTKTQPRTFTLTGVVTGTSRANLQANREALIEAVAPNSVPEQQPIRIRYTGATLTKEIFAYYQAGLEGVIRARLDCWEQPFALRFLAVDPNFYEIGNSSAVLDTNDGANFAECAARLRSTGQWDDLGPPNNGAALVFAIVEDDTYIYWGGSFLNWDAIGNADNIVRWHKQDQVWSALATGLNSWVMDMTFGPDGTLYVVGRFTNAGGDANADYIAQWNGAAFSAVGVPNQGAAVFTSIEAVRVDQTGNVWVGGNFTNLANIANADYVAFWDGAAWNAPAVGADNVIYSLAIGINNTVFASGDFANIGGIAAASIAEWDGSAWNALGSGLNNQSNSMAVSDTGVLYAVGAFTTAGGSTANRAASWNGSAWASLGAGLDATADSVRIAPDGLVYVTGDFQTGGGLSNLDGIAKWNGSTWAHLDIDPRTGGSSGGDGLWISDADPVISSNYDVWFGFSTLAAGTFAGSVTVTNDGTEDTFPVIEVSRSGGTEATLLQIRNETLGLELLFEYSLLDGETLTIELDPTNKNITSNFFGQRLDAILSNSDFGTWRLGPGTNQVTAFVIEAGAPTVVGTMMWTVPYWSAD